MTIPCTVRAVLFGMLVFLLPQAGVRAGGKERPDSLRVSVPASCEFLYTIRPPADCDLLAVGVAPSQAAVWLEATNAKTRTINNSADKKSVAKIKAVVFGDPQLPTNPTVVWKEESLALGVVAKKPGEDGLWLKYVDSDNLDGKTVSAAWIGNGWQEAEMTKPATPAKAAVVNNRLVLLKGENTLPQGKLQRTYQLERDGKGLKLSAGLALLVEGNLLQTQLDMPLQLDDQALAAVLAAHLDKGNQNVTLLQTSAVAVFHCKDAQRGLVVALARLERAVMTQLLLTIQKHLDDFDAKSPDYVVVDQALKAIGIGRALAVQVAAEFPGKELQNHTDIVTDLKRLSDRLGNVVFRLPVKVKDRDWVVYYNIDRRKGHVLPGHIDWKEKKGIVVTGTTTAGSDTVSGLTTAGLINEMQVTGTGIEPGTTIKSVGIDSITLSDKATAGAKVPLTCSAGTVEFAFFNNLSVYFFRLQPSQPLTLDKTDEALLRKQLHEAYNDKRFLQAALEFGLPPNFRFVSKAGDEKIASLKVGDSYLDTNGDLCLVASIEQREADYLKSVILPEVGAGLPGVLEWGADYFVFEKLSGTVVLPCKLAAEKFGLRGQSDGKYTITILLAPVIWQKASAAGKVKDDKLVLQLKYQGTTKDLILSRQGGAGAVEFDLVKGMDGKRISRFSYASPLTGEWIQVEDPGPREIVRK